VEPWLSLGGGLPLVVETKWMSCTGSCSTDSGVRNPSTAKTFGGAGGGDAGGGGGTGGATGGVAGAGAAAAVESAGGGGGERFSTQPATARAAHRIVALIGAPPPRPGP